MLLPEMEVPSTLKVQSKLKVHVQLELSLLLEEVEQEQSEDLEESEELVWGEKLLREVVKEKQVEVKGEEVTKEMKHVEAEAEAVVSVVKDD